MLYILVGNVSIKESNRCRMWIVYIKHFACISTSIGDLFFEFSRRNFETKTRVTCRLCKANSSVSTKVASVPREDVLEIILMYLTILTRCGGSVRQPDAFHQRNLK